MCIGLCRTPCALEAFELGVFDIEVVFWRKTLPLGIQSMELIVKLILNLCMHPHSKFEAYLKGFLYFQDPKRDEYALDCSVILKDISKKD